MRAVFYCRVSTDEENQVSALEDQIEEARKCIKLKEWNLIDEYIDEGKSGTSTKKRDEYNRLCNDLSSDKFDVIVIKSQDRLMRNTREWYVFIDILVSNNKKLFFYLENKFYTPDDALITGIKAILAEEYSRELSKKINNAHKNRQEKGEVILITSSTWGYDKINKEVVVNEKEAEIVRLIYDLCIQGYGSRLISKELTNRNIKSRSGKEFPEATIRKIIRNPLFKGTVVMNKMHIDFNTKKTIHNPESEWIIHEDAVPKIVTEDIWAEANKKMDTRSVVHGLSRKGLNRGKYDFSGKIICGECGEVYWRKYRRRYQNKNEIIVEWYCSSYIKRGRKTKNLDDNRVRVEQKVVNEGSGCDNIHIKEKDLMGLLSQISKQFYGNKKHIIIENAMRIFNEVIDVSGLQNDKKSVNEKKEKIIYQKNLLLDKLIDGIITDEDYKRKDAELEIKLNKIINEENTLMNKEKLAVDAHDKLNDIKATLNQIDTSPASVQTLIEHIVKILVFPTHLEIYFDFYDNIKVEITGKGNKKKYQYVESGKYIIPQTDIYNNTIKRRIINYSIHV